MHRKPLTTIVFEPETADRRQLKTVQPETALTVRHTTKR
jgi:hypothetical protein